MAPRSLNPNARGNVAERLTGRPAEPQRRNVLVAFMAGAIGMFLALFPLSAGLLTFADPLLRKKNDAGKAKRLRVGTVGAVPADGTPVQVPVIADLTDAWNREPNQPVGAVYLRREKDKDGNDTIVCFNAVCPHLGCFVGYDASRRLFQCPCHTSSFKLDGARILPSPSPRDMDPLAVDAKKLEEGEVWIEFENFYPGKDSREAKGS